MILIENINEFVGRVHAGYGLVVMEKGDVESALAFMGFDAIGMFDNMFVNPQYAFLEV